MSAAIVGAAWLANCAQEIAAPAGISLWSVDLRAAPPPTLAAAMSTVERERAARFRFERDRRRYLTAHVALRQLLAAWLDEPASCVNWDLGPFGKPRLTGRPGRWFNLADSGDTAWIALSAQAELGVDVELLRPLADRDELARRHYSTAECAAITARPAADRDRAFLEVWTRKEACLKAIGSGLSIEPASFEAGVASASPCELVISTPAGPAPLRLQSLAPAATVLGAVACRI